MKWGLFFWTLYLIYGIGTLLAVGIAMTSLYLMALHDHRILVYMDLYHEYWFEFIGLFISVPAWVYLVHRLLGIVPSRSEVFS